MGPLNLVLMLRSMGKAAAKRSSISLYGIRKEGSCRGLFVPFCKISVFL